ncbi:hypothetical protein GCM10025876_15320 [Demequina litorisediminis]|uniref:Uncharacterized protein n=1 Tax=Demequina litorisediminis TaxID=1849022 RepID=A0ABQ6IEX8_9MICO|nr:hypothetical protein GCM10025876_15320 [Demequina litorisediminis]
MLMDEPTAALGVAETAKVEETILRLKERGAAVLIVSHNMEQVFRIADRVTVLRRGTQVGTKAVADTTHNEARRDDHGARLLARRPRGSQRDMGVTSGRKVTPMSRQQTYCLS